MDKKNIKTLKKNTYFYKDDKGVTLTMGHSFIYKTSKINDLKADILCRYLREINIKYKTPKEIFDKKRELYSPFMVMRNYHHNNYSMITFTFRMLDYRIVKDNYFDDAVEFAHDILFNPYFVDGKLDSDRFNFIKNDMYNCFLNTIKDFHYDSDTRLGKTVFKGHTETMFIYDTKEELKKDLDSITDKSIIDFYNNMINNHYKTILFGNFTNDNIDKVLKNFKFNNTKNYRINYKETIDLQNEYNEYVSKDYSQSILYFTYRIKDVEKYSSPYYANVISSIVNGLDGILFNLLRTKYGLVYSYDCRILRHSNVFHIAAYIDKKNKDKTIEAIKEFFEEMHNESYVNDRLKYAKNKIKESMYLNQEHVEHDFDSFVNYIYEKESFDSGYIRKINKITTQDILDFFNDLEDENIFFYIGDKDE